MCILHALALKVIKVIRASTASLSLMRLFIATVRGVEIDHWFDHLHIASHGLECVGISGLPGRLEVGASYACVLQSPHNPFRSQQL